MKWKVIWVECCEFVEFEIVYVVVFLLFLGKSGPDLSCWSCVPDLCFGAGYPSSHCC